MTPPPPAAPKHDDLAANLAADLADADHTPPPGGLPLHWAHEDDTAAFARALAAALLATLGSPARAPFYLTLHGHLGAGKTTLVRHLLRALGVSGRIKSPTYTIVEPYATPAGLAAWHFDFYRFADPREWEDAGLRDIFATPGLQLAEWPRKAAALAPAPDLALYIQAIDDTARRITLHPGSSAGRAVTAALASDGFAAAQNAPAPSA